MTGATMDLRYRTATISFCLDLTDPEARTVPVAVFLAGEADDIRIAALATRINHPLRPHLDTLAQQVLDILPRVLQEQVNEIFSANHMSIDGLFDALCDSFRNSLFMSGGSAVMSKVIPAHDALRQPVQAVTGAVQAILNDAIFEVSAVIDENLVEDNAELDQINVQAWPRRMGSNEVRM